MKLVTKTLLGAGLVCVLIAVTVVLALQMMNHHQIMNAEVLGNEPSVETSTEPENDIITVGGVVDTAIDLSNPQALATESAYIVLARIDAIDGTNNYSEISQQYVLPYTFGQMTVLENYKGELTLGEKCGFYRLGGTLPAEQYYAGVLSPEANAKRQAMQAENGESDAGKYVRDLAVGDIEIEAGKAYLVYLVPENSYYGKPDTYAIIGYQGGLREARRVDGVWQVLNNFTGEWEDLAMILGEV